MVVELLIWARLLEFVDEIPVPPAAYQLDVPSLRGGTHRQRACILVAGGVLDPDRESSQRPTHLSFNV